ACQEGDIWEVDTEPSIHDILPDIQDGLENVFPLVVSSGCLVSEDTDATDPFDVTLSAGAYYHDLHAVHTIAAFDTRTANTLIRCFIDGSGPETWDFTADGAQSEIDVANWNSGTSLIGTSVGKYYMGLFLVSEDNVFWISAQEQHNNVAAAIDGVLPSIPPGLALFPRSVAYIYKHGDTAFEPVTSDRWIDVRPLVTGSVAAGPITDHGNLVGLQDVVDHLYALLIDGSRALTGPWAANNDITGVTKLVVDNIQLDGNTINATFGNLTVKPTSGSSLFLGIANVIQILSDDVRIVPGANTDAKLLFIGTTNSGQLLYMEDEDEFRFASLVQATQLKSTVADGTAPLVIASTDVVPNLNADLAVFVISRR
ncbi:hypothetical protein LCGC14_2781240, partial [marine sediment metagenome]